MPRQAPILSIDPVNPQPRHVQRAVAVLEAGGIIAYPTDTYFGIGCDLFQKRAIERMAQLKRRTEKKPFTFLCGSLSEAAQYAIIDNEKYRLMKRLTPGPYTFVLEGTRKVPRTALTRQRQVGVRIPDAPVVLALVAALGRPLATTSATQPEGRDTDDDGASAGEVLLDAHEIQDSLGHALDLILDGGAILNEPSTVLDLSGPVPLVLREGKGKVDGLLE